MTHPTSKARDRRADRRHGMASALVSLLVVVTALAVSGSPAAGDDIGSDELRALAERARSDPAALDELRSVTSVEGRPVDLDTVLARVDGAALDARLAQLSAPSRPAETSADSGEAARRRAERILDGDAYRPSTVPKPFEGMLRWIGDRLAPVGRLLGRLADDPVAAIGLLVALAVVTAATTAVLVRRRGRAAVASRAVAAARRRAADPDALEREADRCEAAGDLEEALRLRFRAGLVRLDRAGALAWRDDATSGALARAIASPAFDVIARDLDEVVYGEREPRPDDVGRARRGWPAVLDDVGHR